MYSISEVNIFLSSLVTEDGNLSSAIFWRFENSLNLYSNISKQSKLKNSQSKLKRKFNFIAVVI